MTGIPSPESEPTSYVAGAVRQAGPRARYFRFQPQVRGVVKGRVRGMGRVAPAAMNPYPYCEPKPLTLTPTLTLPLPRCAAWG